MSLHKAFVQSSTKRPAALVRAARVDEVLETGEVVVDGLRLEPITENIAPSGGMVWVSEAADGVGLVLGQTT